MLTAPSQHEYIHCFQKSGLLTIKKEQRIASAGNYEDQVGRYKREQLRQWGQGDRREDRPSMWFPISTPEGTEVYPYKDDGSEGRWRVGRKAVDDLLNEGLIDFVEKDNKWNVYKKIRDGRKTESVFGSLLDDHGSSATGTLEIKKIFGGKTFETPKPEKLISFLIDLTSEKDDFVLDSFVGSGTTIAVAHKMGRRYIGIELGNHANTHCLPRLRKVVDGNDGVALSEALSWKGGGGFRFYNLAPSLLKKDKYDQWIFDETYNANMLAAAMCKHEGFKFFPDQEFYWKQGRSTETDYIYVTTAFVMAEQLDKIHEEMKEAESLLICAKSFAPECECRHSNITIKKIPQMVLGRCEFGEDNYDLNIVQTTETAAEEAEEQEEFPEA